MKLRPWVVIVVVLCGTVPAWAVPKVALTEIEGDASGDLRDAVASALDGKELEVIGEKETNRAIDKLGVDANMNEKEAKKLAVDLEADAIVAARYNKAGANKVLKFRLFVKGKKLKGFKVTFVSAKSPKFRQMLRDKMVERIESVGEEPVAKKGGKKGKPAKLGDDEDPIGGGKKTKPEPDEGNETDGEGDGEGDDDEREPKRTAAADDESPDGEDEDETAIVKRAAGPAHAANRVALRVDSGISVMKRSLLFNSNLPAEQAPPAFQPAPVPGVRIEGELYPLAFSNPKSIAAGLGVAAEFDRTLRFNVQSSKVDGAIPIKQQHLVVGGRFRIPFGKKATSPTMTLGLGYGRRMFIAKTRPAELDLPDTDYKYLAPHLSFRIPFGPVVALFAGGEGMLVMSAGSIQTAEEYGKAKIFGFDATAGLDIVIGNRFAIRFAGDFVQLGYSFVGTGGVKANSRDMDPSTLDVGGAADRAIGGSATIGVLY